MLKYSKITVWRASHWGCCLAKKRCIFWWDFLVHKIFKSKCKLSLMSNLYAFTLCAASAWSKKCILVHFVFASTLRCLLPDWQYKQKKLSNCTIKGFVIFYLSFFPNLISPDLLCKWYPKLGSKYVWNFLDGILHSMPCSNSDQISSSEEFDLIQSNLVLLTELVNIRFPF